MNMWAIRLLIAIALLVTAILFGVGFLQNVWAASFHDTNFDAYVRRAYICALISFFGFAGSVASILLGNLEEIRCKLRSLTEPVPRGRTGRD